MRKRRFLYWSAAFGALTVVVLMNYYCYRAAMGKYTQLSRSYREEIAGAVQKKFLNRSRSNSKICQRGFGGKHRGNVIG